MAVNLAAGSEVKQRFEVKYAREMDKYTASLFKMGFKCKYMLDFNDPLCPKCCEHEDKVARVGRLKDNCDCVDASELNSISTTTPPIEGVEDNN